MRTPNDIRAHISELQLPAQCGNRHARLELVVERERLTEALRGTERRTHKRIHDWQDKLKDDRRIT